MKPVKVRGIKPLPYNDSIHRTMNSTLQFLELIYRILDELTHG